MLRPVVGSHCGRIEVRGQSGGAVGERRRAALGSRVPPGLRQKQVSPRQNPMDAPGLARAVHQNVRTSVRPLQCPRLCRGRPLFAPHRRTRGRSGSSVGAGGGSCSRLTERQTLSGKPSAPSGNDTDNSHECRQWLNVRRPNLTFRRLKPPVFLPMFSDLKFALRQLAKSPGYTLVVVLTLALGIAVNTNIFGIVGAFFLQPMPVPDADRLTLVLQRSEAWNYPHAISFPDFRDYRARTASFSDLVAFFPQPMHLSAEGKTPERAWIEVVTPNGFSALGVPAALGRVLVPSDGEAQGGQPVAVLTYRFWQNRFGGDPRVVGQVVQINGHPFTIVGVAREGFQGFTSSLVMSAFVPSGAITQVYGDGAKFLDERGIPAWRTLGKLRRGARVAAADAEVKVVTAQLVRDFPDSHKGTQGMVLPEGRCRPDPMVADFSMMFAILFMSLVTLVLLIACANVTNLMLSRALTRQKELTMRAALGASRWRLIRQLLSESLLLAGLAGLAGWFLASRVGDLFARFAPHGDIPVAMATGPAPRDYLFTVVLSLLAGVASGLVPALRASRVDLVESLKESPGGRLADGRHRLRNLLVVSQVAFSLVVLISAGLFVQSLQRARSVNLGFRSDHLLMLSFDLGMEGYSYERGESFIRQTLDKTRALPGVTAAGVTQHVPFDYYVQIRDVWPENPPPRFKDGSSSVAYSRVDPGFFDLMGLRLLGGRLLAETDTESAPRVTVINQAMAAQCWPGEDAIGK